MSKKKSKSSATSTSTATTTPQAPSWIQGPAQDYFSQVGSLLSQNGGAMPTSTLQTQAVNSARNLTGNSAITEGMNGTRGLMDFSPDSVTAGQLRDTDLSPYMNPWENEVVSRSLADVDRLRQGAISSGQAAATRAGAYGGSRHGIADAETNRGYFDIAGNLAAGLRSAGFQNAQQAALTDIGNRLSADTGNADRGLAGAGLRLGAAAQLGQQGLAADQNMRDNIGTQAAMGEVERNNDPVSQRLAYLSQIAQLLGIDPGQFIGQQIDQSGQQSGSASQSGVSFGFNWGPFSIGGAG